MERNIKKAVKDIIDQGSTAPGHGTYINVEGSAKYVAGGDININKKNIIKNEIKPDPERHISEKQARKLYDLVHDAAQAEIAGGMPRGKAYAMWWGRLKKQFGVTSYKLIPRDLGDFAIKWLQMETARNRPKLRLGNKNHKKKWRNRQYCAIFARCKQISCSKGELYAICTQRYNRTINSLKKLRDHELDDLYKHIFGKR